MEQISTRFKSAHNERRSFVRVLDAIGLQIRKLEPGESPKLPIHSDGARSEVETQFSGLDDLRENSPAAAEYILALEKQLGLSSSETSLDGAIDPKLEYPTHKVSLSGSGIAFSHDQLLRPGDRVVLAITFFPSKKSISTVATLVSVGDTASVSGGKHAARAVFSNIDVHTRSIILEHINFVLSKM